MRFTLAPHERASALWQRLSSEFEARRATARAKNDSQQLDEKQTAILRAEIAIYSQLIGLGAEPKSPTD